MQLQDQNLNFSIKISLITYIGYFGPLNPHVQLTAHVIQGSSWQVLSLFNYFLPNVVFSLYIQSRWCTSRPTSDTNTLMQIHSVNAFTHICPPMHSTCKHANRNKQTNNHTHTRARAHGDKQMSSCVPNSLLSYKLRGISPSVDTATRLLSMEWKGKSLSRVLHTQSRVPKDGHASSAACGKRDICFPRILLLSGACVRLELYSSRVIS